MRNYSVFEFRWSSRRRRRGKRASKAGAEHSFAGRGDSGIAGRASPLEADIHKGARSKLGSCALGLNSGCASAMISYGAQRHIS